MSEACDLEWGHIDLRKRELRVLGKGGKTRLISVPQSLCTHLSEKSQDDIYIWGERPLNVRTAYNYIRELGTKAKLKAPLNPHALRHSYATHMLNGGADLRVIQELLGHSDLAATEKYTHITIDHLSQTLENCHPLAKKIVNE